MPDWQPSTTGTTWVSSSPHAPATTYRDSHDALDTCLILKNPQLATAEHIRRTGRGIGYTRAAFAYVFALRSVRGRQISVGHWP